jgi:hypothetical protein
VADGGCLVAFPLILTFSRREKEQLLVDFVKSVSSQTESGFGFAQTLGAFPSLPAGEGRGEGEHSANSSGHDTAENALKIPAPPNVVWLGFSIVVSVFTVGTMKILCAFLPSFVCAPPITNRGCACARKSPRRRAVSVL